MVTNPPPALGPARHPSPCGADCRPGNPGGAGAALRRGLAACAGLLAFAAGAAAQPDPAPVADLLEDFVPVTDAMLREPPPENWIGFRNGYSLWGYSPLDQIDAGNVTELRLVWSRAMQLGYQEVEPIVHDGVMFLANVEDIVQALDATTGDLLWQYRRNLPENIANVTGTRYRYRNVSIYGDKIFLATNDAFMVALDARTGEVVWETQRADYRERVAQTAGPTIVNGKLINGSRCNPSSPRPGGCFITAHDVDTGEELWRINTAATADQPGGDTWGGLPRSARRHASAWMVGSYDPRARPRLLGYGAARAAARDAARGRQGRPALHQLDPRPRPRHRRDGLVLPAPAPRQLGPRPRLRTHDRGDRGVAEPRLGAVDQPAVRPGGRRKVITGIPGKTGLIWTLDAATGEFLWARPTVYQNIMTGLDLDTGRPSFDESTAPRSVRTPSFACPHLLGGKNQPSGAYSPDTNALYMP